MKTKAAVAFESKKPLEVVDIDLEGPKEGEVLVEIKATGICHTDEFTLSGADPEGIFPAVLGHEGAGIVVDLAAMSGLKQLQNKYTPYEIFSKTEQDFIGMTGLVSGDRILSVRAERISRLPKAEREKVISKLIEDTKRDDFFGNITGLNAQLKYMAESILLQLGIITDLETKKTSPKITPNLNKRADEDNYDSGGNEIKIGDTVGYDISRGLNSSTTYDNQVRFTSRDVVIAIQPVEKEVPVPVEIG